MRRLKLRTRTSRTQAAPPAEQYIGICANPACPYRQPPVRRSAGAMRRQERCPSCDELLVFALLQDGHVVPAPRPGLGYYIYACIQPDTVCLPKFHTSTAVTPKCMHGLAMQLAVRP